MSNSQSRHTVIPSPARLVETLRNVGYDFKAAIADLIDNSIAAKATRIDITGRFKGGTPWIRIVDNGFGMSSDTLNEALRYGSNRDYQPDELGKFGLGLKTATHSQCRQLIVATKQSASDHIEARVHDLDHLIKTDKWEITSIPPSEQPPLLTEPLRRYKSGTVILWQELDRMLDYKDPSGRWAEMGLKQRMDDLHEYLGMIFHRFLSKDEIYAWPGMDIYVGRTKVEPWDPFCRIEQHTEQLDSQDFDIIFGTRRGKAYYVPYVLPNIHKFSDRRAHNIAGRNRWTSSQGLWIYRANRLIQDGGWSRIRNADEHTKYARASLEFFPDVDDAFGINIAKMQVSLPASLREDLKQPITLLCKRAKDLYNAGKKGLPGPKRHVARKRRKSHQPTREIEHSTDNDMSSIGKSIEQAATNIGEDKALDRIKRELHRIDGRKANALGW